jgi:hypothetical protein
VQGHLTIELAPSADSLAGAITVTLFAVLVVSARHIALTILRQHHIRTRSLVAVGKEQVGVGHHDVVRPDAVLGRIALGLNIDGEKSPVPSCEPQPSNNPESTFPAQFKRLSQGQKSHVAVSQGCDFLARAMQR